jgi:hypothetical protein
LRTTTIAWSQPNHAHYNVCVHQKLRVTPAMEAGLTGHPVLDGIGGIIGYQGRAAWDPASSLTQKLAPTGENRPCYDATMFNFGRPKTTGDWIVHLAGAIVAIFLVWWMLRLYVL